MPISLRIPSQTEKMIASAAVKYGKSKSAFILEAVQEKLGVIKNRADLIKELAGFLNNEEAEELRSVTGVFNVIHDEDWT